MKTTIFASAAILAISFVPSQAFPLVNAPDSVAINKTEIIQIGAAKRQARFAKRQARRQARFESRQAKREARFEKRSERRQERRAARKERQAKRK